MGDTYDTYGVTLRHDAGRHTIRTVATSARVAAALVTKAELAPMRAVLRVRRVVPRHYVLQGRYEGRWEDLTAEQTRPEANARLREYVENEGGAYRVVTRTWEDCAF